MKKYTLIKIALIVSAVVVLFCSFNVFAYVREPISQLLIYTENTETIHYEYDDSTSTESNVSASVDIAPGNCWTTYLENAECFNNCLK